MSAFPLRRLALASALAWASTVFAGGVDPTWSIARQWDEEAIQAIRLATPRTPVHARTLHHLSVAMYDGWAVYDQVAHGVVVQEKHEAADPAAARRETISYAAYRVLKARFVAGNGPNIPLIQADLDALFEELGYDASVVSILGDSPAEIGNRVAAVVLQMGLLDGANEQANYQASPAYFGPNLPMIVFFPGVAENVNGLWQPLAFDFLVLGNGNIVPMSVQNFVCPHWRGVAPFALDAHDRDPRSGIYLDQGPPPPLGSDELASDVVEAIGHVAGLDSDLSDTIDISPGVHHNSPLGSSTHPGHGPNPVTGAPYAPNVVSVADYHRVAAEHWADGTATPTPAGHWHVIANAVSDTAGFDFRIGGAGDPVDRLEWDVKMYLALGGAAHDAAIASWSAKREHESARPVTLVRFMGLKGQRSDPKGPSYDAQGLPLLPGLIQVVQEADVAPGGPMEELVEVVFDPLSLEPIGVEDHVGDIVLRSWMDAWSAAIVIAGGDPAANAALPGHAYRDDLGWHRGDFELGVNDSAGAPNPDYTAPGGVALAEIRVGQPGQDFDEYVEIAGPPGTDLAGLWLVVIGSVFPLPTLDFNGRVLAAVDLTGLAVDSDGVVVVGRPTLTLTAPDLAHLLDVDSGGSCTIALVTGFSGEVGMELDFLDDGFLDIAPWTSVVDSVSLKRQDAPAGLYLDAPIVPADSLLEQRHGAGWVLADRWMPYQSRFVVSPPWPPDTAVHSAIARASAEALAAITGSPYFPGGLASVTVQPGGLEIESGPAAAVTLEWASFADAADEAGECGRWDGRHLAHDDHRGRIVGAGCGWRAAQRAFALFGGLSRSPDIDSDGTVGAADLGLLLAAWGAQGSPADLDGNWVVDGADLGVLLAAWSD